MPRARAAPRQAVEDAAQAILVVHVLGAVHGRDRVASGLDAEAAEQLRALGALALEHQLVDHGVAGDVDAIAGDAFAEQQAARTLGRREQPVGEMVGQDAIDLLGHGAIVAAQPGFDVTDRNPQLVRGQGAGEHRVGVAFDQHDVGPPLAQDRLHAEHDASDLVRLSARTDFEIDVRAPAGPAP